MNSALSLIKRHEGLRLQAYRCPAGVWTIGWGHTGNVTQGQIISREEAEALLLADVARIHTRLKDLCEANGVALTPNQCEALTSFTFNVGFEAFRRSTLWQRILDKAPRAAIEAEFARWRFAAGKEMPGLILRRAQEATLFFTP